MQRVILQQDADGAALGKLAEQHFLGQRLLDLLLNDTRQRPRTHLLVITLDRQPVGGFGRDFDVDLALGQLRLELQNEFLHHLADDVGRQMTEGNDGVEAVPEFRREHPDDRLLVVALADAVAETDGFAGHVLGAGVRRHDQDHIAEIHRLAIVIGELAVVHHLQENVEQVGMRLLDLVEQQHCVRVLVDAVGQQSALVEADIARRRADEPRHRMALHVFGHVEAQQIDAHDLGQALRHFGLADTRRPREQVAADRLLGFAEARPGELDRRGQRLDGAVLPEHQALQFGFEILQHRGIVLRHGLGGDARHGGDRRLDFVHADDLEALAFRHQHLRRAGFVDHVDRLVGELSIAHVAGRKLHRGLDRIIGVADLVELLVIGLEALEDGDGIGNRRLVDVDLLKSADQRPVLLKMLAVFLVSG